MLLSVTQRQEETATSALTVDPVPGCGQDWDALVRIWEETDAPEGCKVEIIEATVTANRATAATGSWKRSSTAGR
ncbi:hypothetical protein GA0115239_105815 [Streptomyces sp. BpilaLS-43]|nr:hypothetical protein GA0115239_105815 [Streptomyces sp. BpilaLS-43]